MLLSPLFKHCVTAQYNRKWYTVPFSARVVLRKLLPFKFLISKKETRLTSPCSLLGMWNRWRFLSRGLNSSNWNQWAALNDKKNRLFMLIEISFVYTVLHFAIYVLTGSPSLQAQASTHVSSGRILDMLSKLRKQTLRKSLIKQVNTLLEHAVVLRAESNKHFTGSSRSLGSSVEPLVSLKCCKVRIGGCFCSTIKSDSWYPASLSFYFHRGCYLLRLHLFDQPSALIPSNYYGELYYRPASINSLLSHAEHEK